MNDVTSEHASHVLDVLAENHLLREAELSKYSPERINENSDDDTGSECLIYDVFDHQNGSKSILSMTKFSSKEFNILWNNIAPLVAQKWNIGRGRRYDFGPKDVFFMTLVTMKHSGTWELFGNLFKINGTTFERLVLKFISVMAIELHNKFVDEMDGTWHMKKMLAQERGFRNFKFCRYATDVIFQNSYRPGGSLAEGKKYFSAKHKLYGFKTEVSVLPNGLAINSSNHSPISVADIDIFLKNMEVHSVALQKREKETKNYIVDTGELVDEYENQWGTLVGKGYQGLREHIRAVHPTKKPPKGVLSLADEEWNKKISADRVIVENFFGRLTQLWTVIGSKYRWGEKYYDDIFAFSTALTNAHINLHPLRREDGIFYNRLCNRIYKIGEEITNKRKITQKRYRDKRQRRMSAKFRELGSDDDTINPNVVQ